MNNLNYGKTNTVLDYIGIIVFAVLIIFWCDLDIQGWLVANGLNTNIRLGLGLCCLVVIGILLYKYVSQTLGVLAFVIILLITKAMLGYTELFTVATTTTATTKASSTATTTSTTTSTTKATATATLPKTTNPNLAPISELSGSADEVQQFLLRQIADDPNTTTVDKRVMADLTERYFKSSSKLAELRGFNIVSETANMLPGQQTIVGLGTVSNQH